MKALMEKLIKEVKGIPSPSEYRIGTIVRSRDNAKCPGAAHLKVAKSVLNFSLI